MKSILKFLVRGFAVVGFLVVAVSAAGWGMILTREKPKLPNDIILTLDMRGSIPEKRDGGMLNFSLETEKMDLRDTIAALDLAARDKRVKVVIGSFRDDATGYAEASELRDAVYRLRSAGKLTFATATSFGELGPADKAYYIASSFGSIWLQPVGVVGITGLAAQMPFLRGTLDKIGVTPDFVHREEYKTAMDMVSEYDFTPANAEMMESILDDIAGTVAQDIAVDRDITPLDYFRLTDKAPLTADEAMDAGLVDQIGYFDDVADWSLHAFGDGARLVKAEDYLAMRRHEMRDNDNAKKNIGTIAYIHAVGEITQGESKRGGMSADEISDAIRDAVNDSSVEALLLRIDSPGGSAVASETIRHALQRARVFAGLPIIVSMGSTAGSGAYWVASEADYIVADPATLTGSIGVIAGKAAGTQLWEKLGINWGTIARGENADMWTMTAPFTAAQHKRLDDLVGGVYDAFKQRVAEGRDMTPQQVAAIAKGRVWTGQQALQLGLVDELGGFYDALVYAKGTIGVAETDRVLLKTFPAPENFLEKLTKSFGQLGGFGVALQRFATWMEGVQASLAPLANALQAKPASSAQMPDIRLQ